MNKYSLIVGNQIKKKRRLAKMTQGEVASLIGLSRQSLANMEAGKHETSYEKLYLLADALGCNASDFFLQTDTVTKKPKYRLVRQVTTKIKYKAELL